MLSAGAASAQAPTWELAMGSNNPPATTGISVAMASAADASGNIFITGYFTGTVRFGSTTLINVAGLSTTDVFVAKWDASAQAFTWATSAGGSDDDEGRSIAVSGSNVYVTGLFTNSASIAGQQLTGAGLQDVFVAKYLDTSTGNTPATSSFVNAWVTSGGGVGIDVGTDIAVSGTGVYVTGVFASNSNARIAGQTLTGAGGGDVFVAKYVDTSTGSTQATSSFADAWATSGGGPGGDTGHGIAVSGINVYVTGTYTVSASFALQSLAAAGNQDIFVAKYIDTSTGSTTATSSFENGWVASAGGIGNDIGFRIAASGPNVYVTGFFTSNTNTRIAGQPLAGAGGFDVFVAKYIDTSTGNTSLTSSFENGWATSGGGLFDDMAHAIAVSGTSVYITGAFATNTNASFAGQALQGAGGNDIFMAKYLDTSTGSTTATSSFASAWATSAGGVGSDRGRGIVLSGGRVYAVGQVIPTATFGSIRLTNSTNGNTAFLAGLSATALASAQAEAQDFTLSPNPAQGTAQLTGVAPHAAVTVLDALGRPVFSAITDAAGTVRLALPTELAAGVYLVRSGTQVRRLVVN